MSNDLTQMQWREIESISEQMFALAHKQEWEAMEMAETQRHSLLQQFIVRKLSPDMTEMFAKAVVAMQRQNRELIDYVEEQRSKVKDLRLDMAKGKRVSQAYRQNSPSQTR